MRDSIVIDMEYADYDLIDATPFVERHHIFEGNPYRKYSDEDGLWVPLTPEHHRDQKNGVHSNKEMKALMHIIGQLAYEKHLVAEGATEAEARERFRKRYGRSHL